MKILIVLVSRERSLTDTANVRQESLIPSSARAKLRSQNVDAKVVGYSPLNENSVSDPHLDFSKFIIEKSVSYQGIACFVDHEDYDLIGNDRYGLFVGYFERMRALQNPFNTLSAVVGRGVENFAFLLSKFQSGGNFSAFILPYHTFSCDCLSGLGTNFRDLSLDARMKREIDAFVAMANARRRPKEKGGWRSREIAFVDDREHYFCLGHEHHAEAETGGDHEVSCSVEKLLRFGVKFPQHLHFNVTAKKPGKMISGLFRTCHGNSETRFGPSTHLNVFPNNFVEAPK